MSKIMVNPTLFISCRLCLEELGVYQIVPEVQEQILYCFGISIEAYDGLPPLICNKCEQILSQYSELKKKYIANQQELLTKIIGNNGRVPQANQVPSVPTPPPKPVTVSPPKPVATPPLAPTPRPETPKVNNQIEQNVRSRSRSATHTPLSQVSNTEETSWKKDYKKKFQCRFCYASYVDKKYFKAHFAKHKALKAKYRYIFRKFCQVELPKVDGISNFTGSENTVVYNNNKIIESRRADHFVVYFNKDSEEHNNRKSYPKISSRCNSSASDKSNVSSIIRKRTNRRRISSSSSNETVVLDDKGNVQTKTETGIHIDDSDNENVVVHKNKKMLMDNVAKETDKDGIIGKIVSVCCQKYEKSHSDINNVSDNGEQIKRKVLSLGRKIINTKNFNSQALMKFLQYKNIDVFWIPRSAFQNNATESNFVKIQVRKKNNNDKEKTENNWVDYSPAKEIQQFSYEQCCIGCGVKYVNPILNNTFNEYLNGQPNDINITDMSDSAVLFSVLANDTKKLLNANPVANPKQLPKKSGIERLSPKVSLAPGPEPEICMPIITSTTSLADIEKPATEAPRIKVKPVSELMSKESLRFLEPVSRVNQPVVENPPLSVSNIYIVPGNVISLTNNMSTINTATVSQLTNTIPSAGGKVSDVPKNSADYLILDTVELPNTKTYSPFIYFKNLLQIHNIVLLDPNATLTTGFHCLIRFKVCYHQEPKDQPLTLCLSLHCRNNVFCLKVKGKKQEDIDITKITANWQWEVLKIYQGEVVEKILETATKMGRDVLEYTNSFLCLLRSISSVPINT